MNISLHATLLNKNFLKISSLLIGYAVWSSLSTLYTTRITITIPLYFYESPETDSYINTINPGVETITVTLKGKKSDLYAIDFENLAVHYNKDNLLNPKQLSPLSNKELLLPSTIQVEQYQPLNFFTKK